MRIFLLCAVLGVLVFSPSLFGGYPLDDAFLATASFPDGSPRPLLGHIGTLSEYFSSHWWLGHYEATELFRPLTKLSLALVHGISRQSGLDAALLQHLVNLLLYAWACFLVPMLVLRLTKSQFAALSAGLVFAMHALHGEAVCTLTGRAEILAFACGLQATLLLLRGAAWSSLLASLLFFLAFSSKESALAWLPFAALVAGTASSSGTIAGWRRALRAVLVAAPAAVAFLLLRSEMIAALPVEPAATNVFANPLVAVDLATRWMTAIKILGFGLARVLFPIRLSADHGPCVFEIVSRPADLGFLISAFSWLVLVSSALYFRRRSPLYFLAVCCYAVFAFLTSNLAFPIGTIYAERLLFSPSLGLSLALGALVVGLEKRARLAERKLWKPAVFVPLVLWLAHCASYAVRRSLWWKNTDSIALHDVQVEARSANLQRLASAAFVRQGDRGSAIEALRAASKLEPAFAATWLNLAALTRAAGDAEAAERLLREGLEKADPRQLRERAMLHRSLAHSLEARGQMQEAQRHLSLAAQLEAGTQEPSVKGR